MITQKKIRVGAYGVVIHENKVLMVRTQSGSKLIRNFPGGGVEMDETLVDSLKRECHEELGAPVDVGDLLYVSEKMYAHEDFPEYAFFGLYYTIILQGLVDYDLHGARWFGINNLPIDEMLPMDKDMISKVFYLNKHTLFE
jgi:8-oxo-dGTP pyrophosphatase MutT (NUDIX family)